jgi:SNF2 family DNA or RNA helicase
MVYRLVTSNSVDERVLQRAKEKMLLDEAFVQNIESHFDEDDLKSIISFGTKVSLVRQNLRLENF